MDEWDPTLLDASLEQIDPLVADALDGEAARQRDAISLLAPSMFMPRAVRQALSSLFSDLDAEGYAGRWQDEADMSDMKGFCDTYTERGPR